MLERPGHETPDQENDQPEGSGTKWAAVAGVAAIACCVGHALLLAIGLGAVGAAVGTALTDAYVVVPAVLVLVVAAAAAVRRHRRRRPAPFQHAHSRGDTHA